MKKVRLTFPTYDALWLFKEKTRAINVSVVPRNHAISGLFLPEEIDRAVKEFHAVHSNGLDPFTGTSQ